MVTRVFVIGVGMTKFDKPGRRTDVDYPDYAKEAVLKALEDSKVSYNDVKQACVGYVYGDSTSAQRSLYEVGLTGIPIYNINNNCSTGSSALMLAKQLVEVGNDCVLALGFEKMERGSLGSKFTDRTNPMDKHIELMADIIGIDHSPITAQMFGNAAIEHMERYGTKPEHLAKIAYKNHKHSVNNPNSQFREEYTLEQIQKSPTVYGPLTKLECCPTSDGAAAAVLASEAFVRKHGLEDKAVEILGIEMTTDLSSTFSERSLMKLVGYDMTKDAAERLFRKTNYKPTDVDVVELHDCFAANELITYEALGLCPPGKAGELIDSGNNTYGGKYVINPSGGLISKGHPLGATGLAQCAELCWQLRGEAALRQVPNAKLALQHNIGLGGAAVVALYKLGFSRNGRRQVSARGVKVCDSPEGFKVTPYMKIFEQAMLDDSENLIEKVRGIYGFRVKRADGDEGYWVINAKVGKGSIEYNGKMKTDVTFIINDEDVVDLISGTLNPQKAFFQGKIKIQGNMGLALKLADLQRTSAKRIEELRAKL